MKKDSSITIRINRKTHTLIDDFLKEYKASGLFRINLSEFTEIALNELLNKLKKESSK